MSTYNVRLLDTGTNSLNTLKALRASLYIGVFEAKKILNSVPTTIAKETSKYVAEEIKRNFDGVATVELVLNVDNVEYNTTKPKASIVLGSSYDPTFSANELSLGEIVYLSTAGGAENLSDLRLVTKDGLFALDGSRGVVKDSPNKAYKRYPKGTVITFTI
jgi:hypothetical protein